MNRRAALAARRDQAGDGPKDTGLAGPARTENGQTPAGRNTQADVLHDWLVVIDDMQMADLQFGHQRYLAEVRSLSVPTTTSAVTTIRMDDRAMA